MVLSIPLALLQLIHQRVRFIVTLLGIGFVVILLFMQLGFRDALFVSAVRVHESFRGELYMLSSQYKSLTSLQPFERMRLYQTLSDKDVYAVDPVRVQFAKLRSIDSGKKSAVFIFGIEPGSSPFQAADINQGLNAIKNPSKALFDRKSRPEFGPIAERFNRGEKVTAEVSTYAATILAQKFEIAGLFDIGTSFGIDGSMIVNSSVFINSLSRDPEKIQIGVITLNPGADPEKVKQNLISILPKDVKILTRQEFIKIEQDYWDLRTPIGFTFKIMMFIGFIVGIGVAYQILYTNISSHLIEFATLKAIGFRNSYLLNTVFQQAILIALLGFIPGFLSSIVVYDFAYKNTALPISMTSDKFTVVFLSVIGMCVASAALAIQKLRSADPADIF